MKKEIIKKQRDVVEVYRNGHTAYNVVFNDLYRYTFMLFGLPLFSFKQSWHFKSHVYFDSLKHAEDYANSARHSDLFFNDDYTRIYLKDDDKVAEYGYFVLNNDICRKKAGEFVIHFYFYERHRSQYLGNDGGDSIAFKVDKFDSAMDVLESTYGFGQQKIVASVDVDCQDNVPRLKNDMQQFII